MRSLCPALILLCSVVPPSPGLAQSVRPDAAAETGQVGQESPQDLVDDLRIAFGKHKARAVHAKGVILQGRFIPTSQASSLSKAAVFAARESAVTARFSDFTGIPDIPDNVGGASPRGFAIKLQTAGAPDLDVVSHAFNGFPVKTADEFGQLLRAIGTSAGRAAKPTPLDAFLETHPVAKAFLQTQRPAPASFATLSYFGVNAFRLVNASGAAVAVRYRFVPQAGEHFADPQDLAALGPDYLAAELRARLANGPIAFDWWVQLAEPGDVLDDPSIAWPEQRELVKVGTIFLQRIVPEPAADRGLLFLPGALPDGVQAADPMILFRSAAYPLSFRDRQ